MSISSYRRNVSLGVTGKYTDTCFPAAFEQLSPSNQLEPRMYRKYVRFGNWYERQQGQAKRQRNPAMKDLFAELVDQLGVEDLDDVEFERADTYREFSTIVRKLVRHDFRISVDITTENCKNGEHHALGILAVGDDYYRGISTWVPRVLHGYVDLRQIFEEVYMHSDPYRERYPWNDANITALPPAA